MAKRKKRTQRTAVKAQTRNVQPQARTSTAGGPSTKQPAQAEAAAPTQAALPFVVPFSTFVGLLIGYIVDYFYTGLIIGLIVGVIGGIVLDRRMRAS